MGWGKTVYTTSPSGLRMVNGMYSMNTRQGISMRMIGVTQLQEALKSKESILKRTTMAGLIKVAMHIKQSMEEVPPLMPEDTGLMRTRFQIRPIPGVDKTPDKVLLGWPNTGADEYAPYVHEMTQPPYEHPINWSRPGSGPKFFEAAVKRTIPLIPSIVANDLRAVI